MVKRKLTIKKPIEVKQIFKTVNGRKQRYVNVTLRRDGKTTNKQYKYRGGRFDTYVQEAKLPKGTKYYVNYRKNELSTNLNELDALVKKVRSESKKERLTKKTKVKDKVLKKERILKKFNIIPKRVYHPPKPIESEKVVDLLSNKVYYEREHSIAHFNTINKQNKFLKNILINGTKNSKNAEKLIQNFDKIKLKMSYAIVIEAVNKQTGEKEQIATFTTIGQKPLEIVQFLKETNLHPQDTYVDVYNDVLRPFKSKLESNAVYFNKVQGEYRITDARVVVKFYNNPQTTLK